MDKKYKVIAIFGKSAAGKDTLATQICETLGEKAKKIVSCTTRPKRDYEKDGEDYIFIKKLEFDKHIANGDMLEFANFNGWNYGTPLKSLDINKINVGVFNLEGIRNLIEDKRLDVFKIYLACDDKVRLMRALEREEHPNCYEICRRFMADDRDFYGLEKSPEFYYATFDGTKPIAELMDYVFEFIPYRWAEDLNFIDLLL